jgi:dihydrofolate synthase/folylpolyglutamate synthase
MFVETMQFRSAADVFNWLSHYINQDLGQPPSSFRPERMAIIASVAGHPEKCAPAIHVAGSKGKGSVTAMMSSILNEAALLPARYMSPHVTEYRERITQDNVFFAEEIYVAAGEKLRQVAGVLSDPGTPAYKAMAKFSDGSPEPTFFELLTLFYFFCAKLSGCKSMAVETGMGGRLDPTNIVPSEVSVITGVELEHVEFLGESVQEIAGEKAGIIKAEKPCILGEQTDSALTVFEQAAAEKKSRLYYFPKYASLENVKLTESGTHFTLAFKGNDFFDGPLELFIPLPGLIQASNAALAVMAVRKAFPQIALECYKTGLAKVRIPARFEKISNDPIVIIDGAHTNNSAFHCVKTFSELYGDGGILLFGCVTGKNAAGMAASLLPHFSSIIITTPGNYKMSDPKAVFEVFQKNSPAENGSAASSISSISSMDFIKETGDALKYVLDVGKKKKLPILCVGSFYLAADVRKAICG